MSVHHKVGTLNKCLLLGLSICRDLSGLRKASLYKDLVKKTRVSERTLKDGLYIDQRQRLMKQIVDSLSKIPKVLLRVAKREDWSALGYRNELILTLPRKKRNFELVYQVGIWTGSRRQDILRMCHRVGRKTVWKISQN